MSDNQLIKIEDLAAERDRLLLAKREHEGKLLAIKNLIRAGARLSADKYKETCNAQQRHVSSIHSIEKEILSVKRKISELSMAPKEKSEPASVNQEAEAAREIISELVKLRSDYESFAADGTRISSMRQMAAEFVIKLGAVIKRAINPPNKPKTPATTPG